MLKALRELLMPMGASQVLCADISALEEGQNRGYPRALLVAAALDPGVISRIPSGPHGEYSDLYVAVNHNLDRMCLAAQAHIQGMGYRAHAITRDSAKWSRDTCKTDLPHKTVARLAGLGWIGKSAMLVTEAYGTAVRLSTVLTDAPIETGVPMDTGLCGGCDACVAACPGNAYSGKTWDIGVSRDEMFDTQACQRATRERGRAHPEYAVACGLCIAACPYTGRYIAGA